MHMLTYISQAQLPKNGRTAAVDALVTKSRARNAAAGITGVLFLRGNVFFQTIEGPADAVHATFRRIRADHRHNGVYTILNEPVSTRRFADWSLGAFHNSEPQPGVMGIMRELGVYLTETNSFNPHSVASFTWRLVADLARFEMQPEMA